MTKDRLVAEMDKAAETIGYVNAWVQPIRGRVMSLYIMVLIGGQAIGGPMMGWLAEHADPHTAVLVSGGVPVLAAATVAVVLARRGQLMLKVDLKDRRRLLRIVRTDFRTEKGQPLRGSTQRLS